jgi:hypothetical protein
MAIDIKYGKVTLEHGTIGVDEPVVVFRATDSFLPKLLAYYHLFCLRGGSPRRHLDIILDGREKVLAWQRINGTRTPNSENSKEWME